MTNHSSETSARVSANTRICVSISIHVFMANGSHKGTANFLYVDLDRHSSSSARLLGSRVQVSLRAWMLVSLVFCVLCR
jgi:prepilin-type processing-associated H-X9-DG protein